MNSRIGSVTHLIRRADGRPVYCTASAATRPALITTVIASLRQPTSAGEFVNACATSSRRRNWRHHWLSHRDCFGAAIVITRAEATEFGIEHPIDVWTALEIADLLKRGRPIAWQAIEFPSVNWYSRFRIDYHDCFTTTRWAQLVATPDAESFEPIVSACPLIVVTQSANAVA